MNAMLDLKTIIDNLPIAILVISKERRILLSNRFAQRYHSQDQFENRTNRIGDVLDCVNTDMDIAGCGFSGFCPLCRVKAMIDKTFAKKESVAQFEVSINARSKGIRSLRIGLTYISRKERLNFEQEICIATIEDMTELRKQERMAAASETIGGICHEMNQPLQAILGNAELLAKLHLGEDAIARINIICREIERIKSINSRLLNFTHYQTKPYLSTNILDVERSAG